MNTVANQKYSISAQFLGPIFSLNGELTKNAQNLVFARNGTGKSFLSRAFRYLDLHGQDVTLDDAPRNLVSDESPDGKGAFSFGRAVPMQWVHSSWKKPATRAPYSETTLYFMCSQKILFRRNFGSSNTISMAKSRTRLLLIAPIFSSKRLNKHLPKPKTTCKALSTR